MGEISEDIIQHMQSGKYHSSYEESKMTVTKRAIPRPPKAEAKAASTRPPAAPKASVTAVPAKDFIIQKCGSTDRGNKFIIYAESGMGKSTLACLAPVPVFIDLDDGIDMLRHPVTSEPLERVPEVETFGDVRAALQAPIFANYKTIIVDTTTVLEELAVEHVLAHITNDKGHKMDSIIRYGYNKGYRHLYDTMKLVLQDCDALIRQGKNVILIAQSTTHRVSNPGGDDFLRDGPRLYGGTPSTEALYCEWADHIFRIGYQYLAVDDKKATGGENKRAVFVHPEPHFRAKSRTLGPDKAVVEFADPTDDSIWQFLFGE